MLSCHFRSNDFTFGVLVKCSLINLAPLHVNTRHLKLPSSLGISFFSYFITYKLLNMTNVIVFQLVTSAFVIVVHRSYYVFID